MPSAASPSFVTRLESLRGLAAVAVLFSHTRFVFLQEEGTAALLAAIAPMINGQAAVVLFFVLSGYVLGLSLRRSGEPFLSGILRYVVRRMGRIYPAFIASLLLTALGLACVGPQVAYPLWTRWFAGFYTHLPTLREFWENVGFRSETLNPVAWTLQVEMINSLLLPFLHRASRRLNGWGKGSLLLALTSIGLWCGSGFAAYLYAFYLGYLLRDLAPAISRAISSPLREAGVLLLALAFFWIPSELPRFFENLLFTVASALLIGAIAHGCHSAVFGLLDHPVARFLGRVSYSFYLLHFFMLYLVARSVAATFSPEAVAVYSLEFWVATTGATLLLTVGAAALSYRWVEEPGIRLSRRGPKPPGGKPLRLPEVLSGGRR